MLEMMEIGLRNTRQYLHFLKKPSQGRTAVLQVDKSIQCYELEEV